ncbi:MAG: hypothetical protein GF409_01095 [Candidatus Omnitrophica bacterium]|nr:hypothetical protein [Candidatus Omnitrophota bacterium]
MGPLTPRQWHYFKQWVLIILAAELLMLLLVEHLVAVYLLIAAIFIFGLLLRTAHTYPGKEEPLILDVSAVLIAFLWALFAHLAGAAMWRFLLIFTSSAIILPHLVHIFKNGEIE